MNHMHMFIVTGFTVVIFWTINIHQRPFTIGWASRKGGAWDLADQALQQQATGAQQRQEKVVKLLRDPISVGWWCV